MLSFSCAMCRYSTDTPGNHCCIHSINSKSKKRTRLIIRSGMGIASTQSLSRVGRYNPQHSNSLSISSSLSLSFALHTLPRRYVCCLRCVRLRQQDRSTTIQSLRALGMTNSNVFKILRDIPSAFDDNWFG